MEITTIKISIKKVMHLVLTVVVVLTHFLFCRLRF